MFEKIADGVEGDAPCCDEKAPKIKAPAPLERGEDEDIEFEEVVQRNAEEDDDDNDFGVQGDHDCAVAETQNCGSRILGLQKKRPANELRSSTFTITQSFGRAGGSHARSKLSLFKRPIIGPLC